MRQWITLTISSLALISAGLVLYQTGLPQHADYTGQYDNTYGYVAPEIGYRAPPFTATLLNGTTIYLYDLEDRPVIINFWATWCVPCKIEMPMLMDIASNFPDVAILAVNTGEATNTITAWLTQHEIDLPVVLDSNQDIAAQYRLRGQPTTFVIAPDGTIRAIYFGIVNENELSRTINDLLK